MNFYNLKKGDMTCLLEHIPISDYQNVPRLLKSIERLISSGKLKKYKKFKQTKTKVKKLKDESKAAKKLENDFSSL